jgi:hypothetical protein
MTQPFDRTRFSTVAEVTGPAALVLLVGEAAHPDSSIARRLARRGCECRYAQRLADARHQADCNAFDLVLSDRALDDGNATPLASGLLGSSASLFLFQPVEDGGWWVPVIRRGRYCLGEAALPAREFGRLLDSVFPQSASSAPERTEKETAQGEGQEEACAASAGSS